MEKNKVLILLCTIVLVITSCTVDAMRAERQYGRRSAKDVVTRVLTETSVRRDEIRAITGDPSTARYAGSHGSSSLAGLGLRVNLPQGNQMDLYLLPQRDTGEEEMYCLVLNIEKQSAFVQPTFSVLLPDETIRELKSWLAFIQ